MTDWRLPENRREAFQRFYSHHLKYQTHPGCVYFTLRHMAEELELSREGREWLVWLNGNTQNPASSLLLLEASDCDPKQWRRAVEFWNTNFTRLEWDTDRRHQKSKFGEATEKWAQMTSGGWDRYAYDWDGTWAYALSQPYMGRLSAWSMAEYARILLEDVPDADTLLLHDKSGSRSHRNGLAVIAGHDAWHWDAEVPDLLGITPGLERLGEELLAEAYERNPNHRDVGYLTMESALCTYKSWHKPNRRYPNVYADMMYERLRKAEARFGDRFGMLWEARVRNLPDELLLEKMPHDPGLSALKQNWYRETGEIPVLSRYWDDMHCGLDDQIDLGLLPVRKDKKWN